MYQREPEKTNFDDVGDFHHKFDLHSVSHLGSGPTEVDPELMQFRVNFMLEELGEFLEALGGRIEISDIVVGGARSVTASLPEKLDVDHAQAFDALLDLVYVALGTAHFMGYPWQHGWRRVQAANISKVRAQADGSDSKRGSSFDVVKPEGWKAPDIESLLKGYGWNTNNEENHQ